MSWGKPADKKTRNANGGLTKETQSLIDGMIANKNLSKRAAADVRSAVASGSNDWVHTLNSGVAHRRPSNHLAMKQSQKVAVPKVGNQAQMAPPSLPTGTWSGMRMQSQIKRGGVYEREQYQTKPPPMDREREKDRLARRFELGREKAQRMEAAEIELDARMRRGDIPAPQRQTRPAAPSQDSAHEQLIDQIIMEITERRAFLEDMRSKGQGKRYEDQILSEISERLAELRRMGVNA